MIGPIPNHHKSPVTTRRSSRTVRSETARPTATSRNSQTRSRQIIGSAAQPTTFATCPPGGRGRYCDGTGVPSTCPAILRWRSASQRVAGMLISSNGMPTMVIARMPPVRVRTASSSASTDVANCSAA
jgi:hypothetical protein